MKGRLLLLILAGASLNAYGTSWPDLWSRPDQRAQALLDAGHPAAAIPLFTDPQRKAYAQIEAGQFDRPRNDCSRSPIHCPSTTAAMRWPAPAHCRRHWRRTLRR